MTDMISLPIDLVEGVINFIETKHGANYLTKALRETVVAPSTMPAATSPVHAAAAPGAARSAGPAALIEHGNRPIHIWADGACSGNPGPAGAGWIIVDPETDTEISHGSAFISDKGTNNMAEILAAAYALESIAAGATVTIKTDSNYVVGTMTQGWKRKANTDLWDLLDQAVAKHYVTFEHVKGHNGNRWNEAADRLAVTARSNKSV